MLTIVDLLVADERGGYVPCLTGNLITIPASYVKYNKNSPPEPYLDFVVTLRYFDFLDEDNNNAYIWKPAYLKLDEYAPYGPEYCEVLS
jgi:hypothetical protein